MLRLRPERGGRLRSATRSPFGWRLTLARVFRLALLCVSIAAAVAGCSAEPCVCPAPDACPPAAAAPVAPAPAPIAAPAPARVEAESPRAQLALDTLDQLFQADYASIRRQLIPELAADLTDDKLASIVGGIVQAHGPPVRVLDAWTSTIREKDELMPAAQVLVKMENDTRIGLMLVFDPAGAVKGLWLRPI